MLWRCCVTEAWENMASVKEGSALHANITAAFASQKGNHLYAVYKGLESTLNDPKKRYPDKVNALLSAWESVTALISTSAQEASETLINWVYRHTLYLVLQGDWPRLSPATKTHLSVTLQRCVSVLSNHTAAPRCRSLIGLVNDPWGHPVLYNILNGATNVEEADVIAFCNSENGDLLSMRLEMLCESKCEDLALRLAEAIHKCLRLREINLLDRNADEQLLYILDIYIALLYRFKKINEIIKELKHFDLKEGLLLIKRCASKNGKSSRVWRQSLKVTELVAQYFLTVAMVKPVSETGSLLEDLITEWALLHKNSPSVAQTLPSMIRKLIQPAESAIHIYAFCQILVQQFGDTLKSFCIELYIRGLTTDMNELEQQKMKNDKAKVREAEVRLSDGFLKLADLVKDNVGVCRECVLTAFSLNPTESCYERIKEMAVASGKCNLPGQSNMEVKDKEVVQDSSEGSCAKEQNTISDNSSSEKNSHENNYKCEDDTTKENKSNVMVDTGQLIKCSSPKIQERTSPLIPENSAVQMNRCNKHPPFDCTKGGSPGELCPECGEFTGIETSTAPKTESGVTKKARTLDALILIKGDTVTESLNYDVLYAPNQVLDAGTLGLTPQLCDDLAVVLSSPRYQMLSWVLDWPELSIMCERYLENVDEIRNTTKELKFLHIDYNQFKDLPTDEDEKDEYYGIEKGYEQWADMSSDTEEYSLSKSRKKRTRRIETTDSDSSLLPRSRKLRKANRLDSSESDYDSSQRKGKSKRKNRRAASLSVSDSDTGTQDSRTDSLGSDGYNTEKPSKKEKNGRNEKTSSRKRSLRKRKEVQHFAMVVSEDMKAEKKSDLSKNEVMKIFAHIEENGNEKQNSQYTPISQMSPDKRSSDPSVLKTLRMFRPHNAKKASHDQLTQMMQSNCVIPQKDAVSRKQDGKSPYTKFAPMLSTLNLNPRIVLTRTDISNQDFKNTKGLAQTNSRPGNPMSQIKPDILCRKSPTKNMSFSRENNQFPVNSAIGDVSVKHDYIKNDLLAKTVPGLNSLDMIVPPPSEATVQVVQLPRNTPSTSNNGQGNSHLPPKTSQASGNASSVNSGQDPDSSSNTREISNSQPSQPVSFSSVECPQVSLPTAATGNLSSSAATHGQPKVSKLSAPVEVKYLTTTSEVNEILRSTLGDGAHQIQTLPLATPAVSHTLSLTKQRLGSRPEVKYLTTSSEVNEILRSTLGENAQVSTVSSATSSQHGISNTDFTCQSKAKLASRTDVRYVTSSSEVNEILRNTQVVQKIGQSPVSLEANACGGTVVQLPTSSHQTNNSRPVNPLSPFPVVKGVDLNVIASFISSKNCSSSIPPSPDSSSSGTTDSQMLQLVCKGRKFQIKPILCSQGAGNRTVVTDQADENAHAQASAPSTSMQPTTCTENEQQQHQQHMLTHSIYDEEFPEFSQTAQTLESSCKEKLIPAKAHKPNTSPLASLPKFQQAFGKSIYNQSGSSSSMDSSGTHSTPIRANDEVAQETQNDAPQENTDTSSQSQATVTSSSSVLSKAVQTTCMGGSMSSQPHTSALVQQSQPNNVDVASTLHVASAGQVFSILQGSPRIAVSAALRVGAGMTVQAIQTSSGVIYMRPEATTLVTSGTGVTLTSTVSTRRNQGVKTASPLTQTGEAVQQTQLPETPSNSVAVAIAPQTSPMLTREAIKRNRMPTTSLQSSSHKPGTLGSTTSQTTNAISSPQMQDPEVCVVESSSDEEVSNTGTQQTMVSSSSVPRAAPQKSGTRQLGPSTRQVRPILHIPGGSLISRSSATNVTSSRQQGVQSVLVSPASSASSASASVNTRLTQNVGASDPLITHSVIEPTVSSTTLEQLREFESVLEQVTNTSQMKERSTVQPQSQTQTQTQTQQHSLLTQQLLLTQAVTSSTSSAMEFTTCTSSQTTPTSYTQEIFPVVSSATATSRVSVTYVTQAAAVRTSTIAPSSASVTAAIGTVGKIASSPVVVVTSYCQSVASPALSVTSQSSSSPCVTPAPVASTTSGKTPPKSSKSSKSKSVKSGTATTTSKASPVPKPQQKPQEDEQTAQRIYAILDEYAEQLRNSPDLNNKPAPRRRSNPPTNPNQSSKRKKSAQTKVKLLGHQSSTAPEMSPGADDPRTLGSEDSSSGITQLSHIQDSPAPSSQNPDDTLSLRATPSLELTTETGNLRNVVSESGELQDNAKQQQQEHQDQNAATHEPEQPEREQSPLQLQSSQSQAPSQQGLLFTESSSIQGRTVIVQDAVPSSVDAAVSGSSTVVAGKPVMVGNSATVPALFAGVRQVIVPVAPGLTASVQARPVVVSSKGSKVIRVHQVTVPGGSLQVTPGMSGMQGTALVVRQINKPGIPVGTVTAPVSVLGQPTVKQVKLPVGSISSQTLTGVTAQPPVVLPPGSHHLTGQVGSVVTSTITHTLSFPESGVEGVLQDSAIRTEPSSIISTSDTILLNAGTSSQAIGLIRRGIPGSFQDRISTSGNGAMPNQTSASASLPMERLAYPRASQVSSVSLDSDMMSLGPSANSLVSNEAGQENRNVEASAGHVRLSSGCQSGHNISAGVNTQTSCNLQSLSVEFATQTGGTVVGSSSFHAKQIKDSGRDTSITKCDNLCTVVSDNLEVNSSKCKLDSMGSHLREDTGKSNVSKIDRECSAVSVEQMSCSSSCQTSQPQLIQSTNSSTQHDSISVFHTTGSNTVCSNSHREDIFIQDRASGSHLQEGRESHNQGTSVPLVPESSIHNMAENGSEKPKQAERVLREQARNENSSSSDSIDLGHSCCKVSGELNKKINPRQNKHIVGVGGVNPSIVKSGLLCRTNTTQTLEYISASGPEVASYHLPSKVSNRLEYINDMSYRLSTKMPTENQDSPWRYVPVVKRVRVAIQSPLVHKDDSEMASDQMGSSLHLTDRDSTSELEDGSQDRRTYLSDAKFGPVSRKVAIATSTTNVNTNTINAYRKLESEAEEKRRAEKLERIDMQQRMVRLERELRLQKSLSEECEDLGVDEPSTSDLFPEADLLLDTNSSPSFDQTVQDASCSQSVGASESYQGSNFRPMEYSSSSQEGSHHESPADNSVADDSEKKEIRSQAGSKKTYGDWKFRLIGKERNKCTLPTRGVGGKLGLLSSTIKSSSSIHGNTLSGSKDMVSRNKPIMDERLNGSSKSVPPDSSSSLSHDSSSMTSINTTNTPPEKGTRKEKPLNGDSKDILSNVLLEKPLNVDTHMDEITEESQDSVPKRSSHRTSSVTNVGNIGTKTHLSVTSSSEDSVTMDAFTANMVASPLDVTIPSPVPESLSITSPTHLIDMSSSRDPLPSLTAAQKFTYTYGKKLTSNRQEVGRIITRSRLNRPNQYLSDHVDSQETWDSSSSQDKTCADDEDSEMSPSSQLSSQPDDGEGNTDVDVVEISNDGSSSSALGSVPSTIFPLLPGVIAKAPISSQAHDITFKSSTNGMDSLDGSSPMNAGKRRKRTRSDMQFTQKNTLEENYLDAHSKEEGVKESLKYDRSSLLREKRFKGFHSVSKVSMPMKQSNLSPVDSNQRKQTVLRSKQHRVREVCEDSSADMFQLLHTPISMTETDMLPSPEESSDNILSKVRLEGKEECSNEGICGTHVKPTRSLRRKGYIRKCQCCNGSPERPKKKKHIAKVEKPVKKGQPSKQIGKTNVVKKR